MDEYYKVVRGLPQPYAGELAVLSPQLAPAVQEVRLRCGQPVQFTLRGRAIPCIRFLPGAQHCALLTQSDVRECFLTLCRHSVYAYEKELEQGFFTVEGGHRVGVAGACGPVGFSAVTSLDLRVARWVTCELPPGVNQALDTLNGGLLVVGPPGSGKTTLLRSMVQFLSRGEKIVCVVDERGELLNAAAAKGRSLSCDVYTYFPKAQGIMMALRTMNPQAIICDELGGAADAAALEAGVASGVVFLASVHGSAREELDAKPQLKRLLATGAFKTAVYLESGAHPGCVSKVTPL